MSFASAPTVSPRNGGQLPVLSVVLPIFNEETIIPELLRRLNSVLMDLVPAYEVIFANDGSSDRSPELLRAAAEQDPRIKVINFSRNFGHQVAITAGIDYSCGAAVIVMDADLQDPPEVLPSLVSKWREGFDVVYAVREERAGESIFKRGTAALFYRLLKRLAHLEIPTDVGDFRLMSRPAVEALKSLRERHRFVRGMVSWVGFRQTAVLYQREARYAGGTKYPLRKMLSFAMDGIASFSFAPLHLATYLGLGSAGGEFPLSRLCGMG
jgi:glycosyltransferase involved in cell wall biosynthesis